MLCNEEVEVIEVYLRLGFGSCDLDALIRG